MEITQQWTVCPDGTFYVVIMSRPVQAIPDENVDGLYSVLLMFPDMSPITERGSHGRAVKLV